MFLTILSVKWQPFFSGLIVLNITPIIFPASMGLDSSDVMQTLCVTYNYTQKVEHISFKSWFQLTILHIFGLPEYSPLTLSMSSSIATTREWTMILSLNKVRLSELEIIFSLLKRWNFYKRIVFVSHGTSNVGFYCLWPQRKSGLNQNDTTCL